MDDVADVLHHGIETLGHRVRVLHNTFGPEGVNIVLGAHLLDRAQAGLLSPDTIVYNVEQIDPASSWWHGGLPVAVERCVVWDYSRRNLEQIRGLTANARLHHVPLGYVPQLTRIHPAAVADIDVLFYGAPNDRRERVLRALRAAGLAVTSVFGTYGPDRDALIARAKVVLNVHYYPSRVFEAARVTYLLANRKAVVAEYDESSDIDADLGPAVRLAAYDDLVAACRELVNDGARRQHYEEHGFRIVTARPAADLVRSALEAAIRLRAW
jgi:hypothetical protein